MVAFVERLKAKTETNREEMKGDQEKIKAQMSIQKNESQLTKYGGLSRVGQSQDGYQPRRNEGHSKGLPRKYGDARKYGDRNKFSSVQTEETIKT
jgi:hypothetical protein